MHIADLHIHSRFSRATSGECDAPHLDLWARKKGIDLIGTGDFTHPAWRAELEQQLMPAEEGLYVLRPELRLPGGAPGAAQPRFVVTGEISSIYKRGGRTRKVHNLILLPGLEQAELLARRLEAVGNIRSDGRPILGLDSRDLLEITLESCPDAIFIPAHIWTPHFSMFGAFSGFETLEECFGDLSGHIHAVETGLSSDPPMNWRVAQLDGLQLVSHSDAHSPAKLGREADLLVCELSYPSLKRALDTGEGLVGTVEFFPEEGKYHLDGHRNCDVCLEPGETARLDGRCPVCGKKLTVGVQNRVEQMASRPEGFRPAWAKAFESLVPLPEVIAASTGASPAGVRVLRQYEAMLQKLGPEFSILRERPLDDIERAAGPCVAEGIRRLRAGQVRRVPGFDGRYGTIGLLSPDEIERLSGQSSLFGEENAVTAPKRKTKASTIRAKAPAPAPDQAAEAPAALNEEQRQAAGADSSVIAVVAGPGAGKTRTLVARVEALLRRGVRPADITAVTFTDQAAAELRQRLESALGGKRALRGLTAGTFHSICLRLLPGVRVAGDAEALELAGQTARELGRKEAPRRLLQAVSQVKNGVEGALDALGADFFARYNARLRGSGLLDFDDLLAEALRRSAENKTCFAHLLVDEFQDINDLQYELVRTWSAGGRSLFVIGDPDQSIYGFRGASGCCFDRLCADRPDTGIIRLRDNYRSTPQVLACAAAVMTAGDGRERAMTPHRPDGAPVRLVTAADPLSEGVFVAKEIARMTGGVDMLDAHRAPAREQARAFSDIAVLCRTHRQAALIERCLRHDDIPAVIVGREDFLQDPAVRGLLGFFRWLLDGGDLASLRLCLQTVWDCPADLIERACSACGPWGQTPPDLEALRAQCGAFPLLQAWLDAAGQYAPLVPREKPHKLLARWTDGEPPAAMQKLGDMAVFYPTMGALLQAVDAGSEADLRRAAGKGVASGAVRLMTLHGAKGLEFPAVFVTGACRRSIPLESENGQSDREEERRLFYVGLTRAREELILTCPGELTDFLQGLPPGTVQTEEAPAIAGRGRPEQLSLF